MEELSEDLRKRAEELLDRWQIQDVYTKTSMAFMLIGFQAVHYGVARLASRMADATKTAEEREAIVALAMERMQKASMQGFQSTLLRNNLQELDAILGRDLREEQKRRAQLQEKELRLGIPLPFESLNTKLSGGLKTGNVVLVHGESSAVFGTIAAIYQSLNSHKVPLTHYCTAKEQDMPDVPGVKNIPGAFWSAQGSTLTKMQETFKVVDGYVALVDRLDWLIDHDGHKSTERSRQLALKFLAKVARRYRISIVVGHVAEESAVLPRAQGVLPVSVCIRSLPNCPRVLVVDDNLYVEGENGISVLGSSDGAQPECGSNHGRAEDGKPEGSGEGGTEDGGVESSAG